MQHNLLPERYSIVTCNQRDYTSDPISSRPLFAKSTSPANNCERTKVWNLTSNQYDPCELKLSRSMQPK